MSTRLIKGRKNIHLAKIENQNNRQVTFSKRRNGVFKKANELAVMSGAEVGIIVCPQGSKPYSFGHPNVNDTINKYIGEERSPSPSSPGIDDKYVLMFRKANSKELNTGLNSLQDQLDFALKLKSKLKQMNKNVKSQQEWFKGPIEKMNYTEASMLKEGLEDLLLKVKNYGTERGYGYENGKWKAE
ncbi:PREDICTED: agamous-like MADS-box protein AGL62 [Nicotiana attenuata]|uniref:Agamous-like mads-box protein agl62 n=1 Tax=Nicotiana attenuata TaxID=49451 RepID=A0A314L2X0_NICAT|nr:PREDICTED: agamous-like MADS-box protein AGL62 [Nicotiana attenuata]OIT36041.1 agamous-like mads-box protein agl62 [Nicotiana attenuata]